MSWAKIEQRNKIIRDTSSFFIQNASFSVQYLETDNVNAKGDKTREHQYVMCNKDFFLCEELLWKINWQVQSISNYL